MEVFYQWAPLARGMSIDSVCFIFIFFSVVSGSIFYFIFNIQLFFLKIKTGSIYLTFLYEFLISIHHFFFTKIYFVGNTIVRV